MSESRLYFFDSLPTQNKNSSLLIADRVFQNNKKYQSFFASFGACYFIEAGEVAKDYRQCLTYYDEIMRLTLDFPSSLQIFAMGGGSITDTVGFLASTLRRGVPLHLIPTTWLCAIDSAHGGKNALNIGLFKNQIGTFYFPESILLIKDILHEQPESFAQDALSEAVKILLLKEPNFLQMPFENADSFLKDHLPKLITYKNEIIQEDPYDQLKIRYTLNLGHSVGHVLELLLGLSHGRAVKQGLHFALEWSAQKHYLAKDQYQKIISKMNMWGLGKESMPPIVADDFLRILKNDKKKGAHNGVHFIFLKDLMQPFVQEVSCEEIVCEAKRQGIVL